MRKWCLLSGVLLLLVAAGCGGGREPRQSTFADIEYRATEGDESIQIGRLLAAEDISVCGEYDLAEIRPSEYAIKCSRDGETWSYFLVFANTEAVLGPYSAATVVP